MRAAASTAATATCCLSSFAAWETAFEATEGISTTFAAATVLETFCSSAVPKANAGARVTVEAAISVTANCFMEEVFISTRLKKMTNAGVVMS